MNDISLPWQRALSYALLMVSASRVPIEDQVVLQDLPVALRSTRSLRDILLYMECVARIYELNILKS